MQPIRMQCHRIQPIRQLGGVVSCFEPYCGAGTMLIAATLSLTIAFVARRFGIRLGDVRSISRDPRWILAAVLAAAVLILLVRLVLFRG